MTTQNDQKIQKHEHLHGPEQKGPSWIDHAMLIFQTYGKEIAFGISGLFLLIVLVLFFYSRSSNTKVDRSIEADLIAQRLIEDKNLSSEVRSSYVTKLIECCDSAGAIEKEYQGLLAQELLISSQSNEATEYLQKTSAYLKKQHLLISEEVLKLTALIESGKIKEAEQLASTLLATPELTPTSPSFLPFTYGYTLLCQMYIYTKNDMKKELDDSKLRMKQLLGLDPKNQIISPSFNQAKITQLLLPLFQEGSISIFDIE